MFSFLPTLVQSFTQLHNRGWVHKINKLIGQVAPVFSLALLLGPWSTASVHLLTCRVMGDLVPYSLLFQLLTTEVTRQDCIPTTKSMHFIFGVAYMTIQIAVPQ